MSSYKGFGSYVLQIKNDENLKANNVDIPALGCS